MGVGALGVGALGGGALGGGALGVGALGGGALGVGALCVKPRKPPRRTCTAAMGVLSSSGVPPQCGPGTWQSSLRWEERYSLVAEVGSEKT